jgi:hypothetical protein
MCVRSWWQQTALLLRYQMMSKMVIYQGKARKRRKGEVDQ